MQANIKISGIFALLLFVILSLPALAQEGTAPVQETPATATPGVMVGKIAFLNFALVLEGTEEAKVEISKVRSFMDQKQSDFDSQSQELEQLKQQFAAQERTLNAQTRTEMQNTIADKDRQLRRFQEDTQLDINKMRDTLFGRLTNKIQPVMSDYAKQNGLSAIFFVDQMQGYFDPELDITQAVIRLYNERYPAGGEGTP